MIRRILIFCLLIMLGCLGVRAKKLSVEKFGQLDTDISARLNQREDLNGEKCALIKVLLPIEGCKFEGSIGDSKFDVNEYWVYVSPGTKRLKIKCPGFETLDVDFATYSDIPMVETLQTYELLISDYDQLDIIQNPDGNMLSLEIQPSGNRDVTVMIDGKPQPIYNGKVSAFLRSGSHSYSVTAPGYIPSNGEFTVTKDKATSIKVKLKSEGDKKLQYERRKSTDIYDDIYGESFASNRQSNSKQTQSRNTSSAFKSRYRGNVEIWGGVNSCKYDLKGETDIKNVSPVGGISTTHGCQLYPFLFVGAGVGLYVPTMWVSKYYDTDKIIATYNGSYVNNDVRTDTWSAYCCMIPVFLDMKLEVDVRRKMSPYLELKVGYQFGSILNKYRINNNKSNSYFIRPETGLYLHPALGLRFRVNERFGINFGISYDADIKRKLTDIDESESVLSTTKAKAFAFNIGFDF